jgi:hypothetical protein
VQLASRRLALSKKLSQQQVLQHCFDNAAIAATAAAPPSHLLIEAPEGHWLPEHGVNFAAKALEDAAELQRDVAAAQHGDLLRLRLQLQRLV